MNGKDAVGTGQARQGSRARLVDAAAPGAAAAEAGDRPGDRPSDRHWESTPRDLGTEAYRRIRIAIRDNVLPPGMRVTEAGLSSRLKMSRTPVREAINRLALEGLLVQAPAGLMVSQPDSAMITEIYSMREVLEGTAAGLAAQHATDEEIETLCVLVEREPGLAGDYRALSQANIKFHRLIGLAAHNRYLLRGLEIMATTTALLPTMLRDPERAAMAHAEHTAIIGALVGRDPEAAETAARGHIRSAWQCRLRLLEPHPGPAGPR